MQKIPHLSTSSFYISHKRGYHNIFIISEDGVQSV